MSSVSELPSSLSLEFLESLHRDYLNNPNSVGGDWQQYFEGMSRPQNGVAPKPALAGPTTVPSAIPANQVDGMVRKLAMDVAIRQDRLDQLVRAYRVRGHMIAHIDPLGQDRPQPPELDPAFYGFTAADMAMPFSTVTIGGPNVLTLRQIIDRLKSTYCRAVGVQYMHIDDIRVRHWLQDRMEETENRIMLTRREQLRIFSRLTEAVVFEEFIQRKFPGAKSFSLEGAESLIPLLDLLIEKAADQEVREIILGMAHRGRLNVLANIIGKGYNEIFREFEDRDGELHRGGGDVKYHLGYSNDWKTASGKSVHLSLCFNPSHLEYVNPVVMGRTRAKQDRGGKSARDRFVSLMIHGDAAFIGEGVVQETLNMSQLPGYTTGGTIHIVVNNQIGFTTGPAEGMSSVYNTDIAKMLQIPIFHVNGENPEAVAQVVQLALDFRQRFRRDVVIDMYCYRRRGHNETDEPQFTQPVLYRAIEQRPSVREGYLDHLLTHGNITVDESDELNEEFRSQLEKNYEDARKAEFVPKAQSMLGIWNGYQGGPDSKTPDVPTAMPIEKLSELLFAQSMLPQSFNPHPKIARLLDARKQMAEGKRPLDWSNAEALAFASLTVEGRTVRLTGQDSGRGTFSQRHAVLYDFQTGEPYLPLRNLAANQGMVAIYNSPLSENGVLGFEYGYSLDCPNGLIMWEAQFGDFANAAQVIIDQFIISAEDKWRRLSGLVLLLPHAFEGSGPEHSSARLERFLSLAAEDNIQVVNLTTPAQYFHCLRRQVLRPYRKPLVVMTPKGLLRAPAATSPLEDLSNGAFACVLPESNPAIASQPQNVQRILLCSGKVYYELVQQRELLKRTDVAIVRLEQIYPLRLNELEAALAPFGKNVPVVWVQDEPENMGAWYFLRVRFCHELLGHRFSGVYRAESASPATGSTSSHKLEQKQLLEEAFAP